MSKNDFFAPHGDDDVDLGGEMVLSSLSSRIMTDGVAFFLSGTSPLVCVRARRGGVGMRERPRHETTRRTMRACINVKPLSETIGVENIRPNDLLIRHLEFQSRISSKT